MISTFHLNITWFLQKYRSEKVLPRFELGIQVLNITRTPRL